VSRIAAPPQTSNHPAVCVVDTINAGLPSEKARTGMIGSNTKETGNDKGG